MNQHSPFSLHHQWHVRVRRDGRLQRRHFLRAIPAAAVAAGCLSWPDRVTRAADQLRRQGRACILLWMQGGPSQFETFDPKPEHANGGETKTIATSVPGIRIADNLPRTAEVMDDLCVIRSMTSREGSHPRATYLLHTGYLPTASIKYPELGSIVASELGLPDSELPSFVKIGGGRGSNIGGGFLGLEHNPLAIRDADRMPDNTDTGDRPDRYRRRLSLLGRLESGAEGARWGGRPQVEDHRKLYGRASRMVLSPEMSTFDIQREPEAVRGAYGTGPFASGCLLARRLVEAGVPFVEVSLGNWDTHLDNFERTAELCGQLDQPYAQLLRDLKQRGLLDRTLVVWMGEFGRTPRVNARGGRDHFPRAFSAALAGGGVRGGQVIGRTDEGGTEVAERPVQVTDLFRTFCRGLEIDPDRENMSGIGRPIRVVDEGQAVGEVFG